MTLEPDEHSFRQLESLKSKWQPALRSPSFRQGLDAFAMQFNNILEAPIQYGRSRNLITFEQSAQLADRGGRLAAEFIIACASIGLEFANQSVTTDTELVPDAELPQTLLTTAFFETKDFLGEVLARCGLAATNDTRGHAVDETTEAVFQLALKLYSFGARYSSEIRRIYDIR